MWGKSIQYDMYQFMVPGIHTKANYYSGSLSLSLKLNFYFFKL